MPNPWFRLYSEFSHDPKVQMMSEVMQRRYLMLMCLRCSNELETLHETEIAFHLRIAEVDLAETRSLFLTKGFIDEQWNLLNWDKRQFASDSSTARVRKLREARKQYPHLDVTLPKRSSNGLEQNRTDTDVDTSAIARTQPTDAEIQRIYKAYPRKIGPMKASTAIRKAVAHLGTGEAAALLSVPEALAFLLDKASRYGRSEAGRQGEFTPHPATWFNQGRYLDDESEWDNAGQAKGVPNGAGGESSADVRNKRSSAAINSVFSGMRGDGPGRSVDGADEAQLPVAGDTRRDPRDLGPVVARDGRGVRTTGFEGGAEIAHASVTILSSPSGDRRHLATAATS
jgi:hypothetical protein